MENNKQKIIFDVPETTSPVQIIINILEKNGIEDPLDDITAENTEPKLVIINDSAKNLFDKKITEEEMSKVLQNKINVSKEKATAIINGIKEQLIPFAKKINISEDDSQGSTIQIPNINSQIKKITTPIGVAEALNRNTASNTEAKTNVLPEKNLNRTEKTIINKKQTRPNSVAQNKPIGKDTYREPIE
jgi:hypothetical protein